MISRRMALSGLPLLLAATQARAQNFPAGQVRIIVPFPPGGATDVLGRVLATHLQALWGQTVISDYRPGAAGLIGTRQVIASPADGHTLLMASTGAILALASGQRAGRPAFRRHARAQPGLADRRAALHPGRQSGGAGCATPPS